MAVTLYSTLPEWGISKACIRAVTCSNVGNYYPASDIIPEGRQQHLAKEVGSGEGEGVADGCGFGEGVGAGSARG